MKMISKEGVFLQEALRKEKIKGAIRGLLFIKMV